MAKRNAPKKAPSRRTEKEASSGESSEEENDEVPRDYNSGSQRTSRTTGSTNDSSSRGSKRQVSDISEITMEVTGQVEEPSRIMSTMSGGTCLNQKDIDFMKTSTKVFGRELFVYKKFIVNSEEELKWSVEPMSLCNRYFVASKVKQVGSELLWEKYKVGIKKELKSKRSNVAYGIREKWMGKLMLGERAAGFKTILTICRLIRFLLW